MNRLSKVCLCCALFVVASVSTEVAFGATPTPSPTPAGCPKVLVLPPDVNACLAGAMPIYRTAAGLEYCRVSQREETYERTVLHKATKLLLIKTLHYRIANNTAYQYDDHYSANRENELDTTASIPWYRFVRTFNPATLSVTETQTGAGRTGVVDPAKTSTTPSEQGLNVFELYTGAIAYQTTFDWTALYRGVAAPSIDSWSVSGNGQEAIIFRSGPPAKCLQIQSSYEIVEPTTYRSLVVGDRGTNVTFPTKLKPEAFALQPGQVLTYDLLKATKLAAPPANKGLIWRLDIGDQTAEAGFCTAINAL